MTEQVTQPPDSKYIVTRRDGTVPNWPWFVLGGRDPRAADTVRDYADRCERDGLDPEYVAVCRRRADLMESHLAVHGAGDPGAPLHREDDPTTIAKLQSGGQPFVRIYESFHLYTEGAEGITWKTDLGPWAFAVARRTTGFGRKADGHRDNWGAALVACKRAVVELQLKIDVERKEAEATQKEEEP